MNKYLEQIKKGLIDENPTFVQFLGMCPTLAVTTSVSNAVGMGLSVTAVLICSNLFISLLRKFIPKEIRIASYIVIISGFVTAIELLLHAFLPSLYASLGIYIPLIVVNCIILARAEAFASKNPPLPSVVDGLAMGLGFTCSLTVIGSVREILGAGTWLGLPIPGIHAKPAVIFILPAGAFLTLGFLAALVNALRRYAAEHPRTHTSVPVPAADAPLTEAVSAADETETAAPIAEDIPVTEDTPVFESEPEPEPEKTETAAVRTEEPQPEEPDAAVPETAETAESTEAAEAAGTDGNHESENDDETIPDITFALPELKEQKKAEDIVFDIVLPESEDNGADVSDKKEGR